MKTITIPYGEIKTAPDMTTAQWVAWLAARGVEARRVIRVWTDAATQATVYECED